MRLPEDGDLLLGSSVECRKQVHRSADQRPVSYIIAYTFMTQTNLRNGEKLLSRDSEAFENIRRLNRDLLVASFADMDDGVTSALTQAREHVLLALRRAMRSCNTPFPATVEELPVIEFKARVVEAQRQFEPLFDSLTSSRPVEAGVMPSKLNGRRKKVHYGCF